MHRMSLRKPTVAPSCTSPALSKGTRDPDFLSVGSHVGYITAPQMQQLKAVRLYFLILSEVQKYKAWLVLSSGSLHSIVVQVLAWLLSSRI
jgi:hypothetical protein